MISLLSPGYHKTPQGKFLIIVCILFAVGLGTYWLWETLKLSERVPDLSKRRMRRLTAGENKGWGVQETPELTTEASNQTIVFTLTKSQVFDPTKVTYDLVTYHVYMCGKDKACGDWENVWWTTDPHKWEISWARIPVDDISTFQRISLAKGSQGNIIFTIKNPEVKDSGVYRLGITMSGADPWAEVKLKINPSQSVPVSATGSPLPKVGDRQDNKVVGVAIHPEDKLSIETGYSDKNEWLEWMKFTANSTNASDCVVCASGRPRLATVPIPSIFNMTCILLIMQGKADNESCKIEIDKFPMTNMKTKPVGVTVYKGNYTCFNNTLRPTPYDFRYCTITYQVRSDGRFPGSLFINQTQALADTWWLCGDNKLRPLLSLNWAGTCTLVKVVQPFLIFPAQLGGVPIWDKAFVRTLNKLTKRDIPGGSFDRSVYLDAVGVPRGVPDEFKARNQIAAGFESIFLFISVNKNTDWINYIYYNQQRFVNYTRDAVKGLAEQLDATSLTAWQNRISLDMLLAERGGVCVMFGITCCTFIPNNTAPDGSVTRALKGLEMLSQELAENSGIEDPFTGWMERWFGKWGKYLTTLVTAVMVVLSVLLCVGCCLVPCMKGLISRIADKAAGDVMYTALSMQDPDLHDSPRSITLPV